MLRNSSGTWLHVSRKVNCHRLINFRGWVRENPPLFCGHRSREGCLIAIQTMPVQVRLTAPILNTNMSGGRQRRSSVSKTRHARGSTESPCHLRATRLVRKSAGLHPAVRGAQPRWSTNLRVNRESLRSAVCKTAVFPKTGSGRVVRFHQLPPGMRERTAELPVCRTGYSGGSTRRIRQFSE